MQKSAASRAPPSPTHTATAPLTPPPASTTEHLAIPQPAHSSFFTLHSSSPPPVPIPVVCAIIIAADHRVLVAQRPPHKHLGLKWEFPGGKVEPNESPEAALVREIKEELGCTIALTRALPRFTHDYGSIVIEMIPFVAALASTSGAPHPHEHVALQWVTREQLRAIDLAPADWPVLDNL